MITSIAALGAGIYELDHMTMKMTLAAVLQLHGQRDRCAENVLKLDGVVFGQELDLVVEQFAQCFTAVHMAEDERVFEFGLDGNVADRSHDFSLSRRRGHTNRWPSRGEQSIIIADV